MSEEEAPEGYKCHLEHEQIASAIEQVAKDLEWHAGEQHGQVMTRKETKDLVAHTAELAAKNAANVTLILDELLGPIHPLSGERRESKGISYKMDTIWQQSQNGGVQAKLTSPQKAAIWTAAIGGLTAIITAIIQVFGSAPPPPLP